MLTGATVSNAAAALAEQRFYSLYAWCLDPIQSVRELFERLGDELGRFEILDVSWQQEESLINIYLFVCAIACSIDDSLARSPWRLTAVSARFPALRPAVTGVERGLNAPHRLRHRLADRPVLRWRGAWDRLVDRVCDLLIAGPPRAGIAWAELRAGLETLMSVTLPASVLGEQMRLPEAFRCQDLTHHDVITLARRLARTLPDRESPLVIVGVRTAGAYFAPLIRALLRAEGWTRVSRITVRPKLGPSRWEARQLRRLGQDRARVVVVDDYPNTGTTVRLMLDLLARQGVPSDRITVAVPRHPARPAWTVPEGATQLAGVRLVTLEPADLYKARLLEPRAIEPLIREYAGGQGEVRLEESGQVKTINAALLRQFGDGFQVRLKRVFEIRGDVAHESTPRRVFVKSVGWGWLGYHAYVMGARLAGSAPRLIGLRNGLLLTEWLDDATACQTGDASDNLVRAIAHYTACRVQQLPLPKDPCFDTPEYRWAGWDEMISILRGVYGPYVGRLKAPALRRRLRRFLSPVPTAVDGRMRPEDWIRTPAGIVKTDFEQHSFGGAELDVVDPAYDLAGAICEFGLPEPAAERLVELYARESSDRTVTARLLLYEILYGVVMMRRATCDAAFESRPDRLEMWNRRRLTARRFLISRMNRFSAGLVGMGPPRWSRRLFFLDLDGVFDCEALGFPHTTPSGVHALRLLRAHDVSVVLNTGRGVEDVRGYCQAYGLAGGLAEFGSVFVDAVAGRELALIDAEGGAELARCRERLRMHGDVCCDPGYRHSIRAYRYRNGGTVGLEPAEVADLCARARGRIEAILRPEDTYILQKGTSKAAGFGAVRRLLEREDEPVAAIGDSEYDVRWLQIADRSYAPANCAPSVRALGRRGGCRVMPGAYQRGFLAAARDLVGETRRREGLNVLPANGGSAGEGGELVRLLLEAAERSTVERWVGALNGRDL
jgi:hydroxymethylpyrimidine pyrophosphatase-like HAD family hydrolase/orotate phosphoribosyltransferase